jgi:hypothetical protein
MSREKIDWSTFSDNVGSLDLFGVTLRKSMSSDSYAGKTRFKARALTDMYELSSNEVMAIDGGSTGADGSQRWAFKGRIIGENSPHSFIPDPCDPSLTQDQNTSYRQITLHTTFLSNTAGAGENVTRGDIVVVEIDRSDYSYNLEYGRFISISSHETPSSDAGSECSNLIGLVGEWGGPPQATQQAPAVGQDIAPGPGPSAVKGSVPSGNLSFTLAELKTLVPALKPLLDLIASTEGGKGTAGYSAVNNGTAPKSGRKRMGFTTSLLPEKAMTSMTVRELMKYMVPHDKCPECKGESGFFVWIGKKPKCPADNPDCDDTRNWNETDPFFATGRYQLIPKTAGWYSNVIGIDGYLTAENQDAVGAALALMKRQTLGKYLLGKTDSEVDALNQLAMEWASFPIYTAGGKSGKCIAGQSHYCGDGTNKAHHQLSNVLRTIRNVRVKVQGTPAAVAVLEANTSYTAVV